jgi:hypothetical protein
MEKKMTKNMWIKQYRNDIPSCYGDSPVEGYIYHFGFVDDQWFENNLHIYKNTHFPHGEWYLCIGNQEWVSDDLAELENRLWIEAVSLGRTQYAGEP